VTINNLIDEINRDLINKLLKRCSRVYANAIKMNQERSNVYLQNIFLTNIVVKIP